ncbi:L-lactate dehydrogenase [Limnochorda pilosa]|uniref:L-lactate dehydrogenase n=1 Tax=Limnochorda pilosa TaxID=1555112 RepID=A0A0K2SFY1_LIMPI|nr:L-lactate dehydrogenase [Limnochorda pilosa]BAS26013.1 lactate dehydrogenase [Limnochorda pilosa]
MRERWDSVKIGVVGSGLVGSTFAYTAVLRRLAREIVLVDVNAEKAEGDAMDIRHAQAFARPVRVRSGSYDDLEGSDLVVLAAGAAQRPGESRLDLLRRNVEIFHQVVPAAARAAPEAILLVATNPVDVLTLAARRFSGFDARRVFGSGTLLDTARFRVRLGEVLQVDPRSIHAYIIGEHGDSELAVWSRATVAGIPVAEAARTGPPEARRLADPAFREALVEEVRRAAYEIIRRKGATYYAIAAALARVVEAVVHNEASVLALSVQAEGYRGAEGLCIGVPAVVDRSGVERVIVLPLDPAEQAGFQRSAEVLRQAAGEAGLL